MEMVTIIADQHGYGKNGGRIALPCSARSRRGASWPTSSSLISPLLAWVSAKDLPVHSAMLSIQLFFGLPLLRLPSTVPCNITLVRPSNLVTCPCPYHFRFCRFAVATRSSYGPICFMMIFRTCSLVTRSLWGMPSIFVGYAKYLSEASKL